MPQMITRCITFLLGYLLTAIALAIINAVSPNPEGTERLLLITACLVGGLASAYIGDATWNERSR